MLEFLQSPVGAAVFGVLIAVILIFLIELNYRYFTKLVLDFIFAVLAVIVLSPVFIICSVISKKRTGQVLEDKLYMGVKGKIVKLHSFAGINGGLKNLPRIFDILSAKVSFVGVKPMEVADVALMDDKYMERFNARPGLINHLVLNGFAEMTYEETFVSDARYAKKRELFTDIFIVIKSAVSAVRGDGKSYLGEAADKSYAQALIERGTITKEDMERANEYAREAIEEQDKRSEFKKQRYN
ncbi:MAG: sugar transferase [Clostridia bacterium]|nr:sugar transferase [Clostridia bacterium]